jgi:hypothetical protein
MTENMYPRGQISQRKAERIYVVNLLINYRNQIHELAVATNPQKAHAALQAAQKTINELEGNLSDKEIMDMRETVSVFFWKASRRMSEGI